MLVTSTIKKSLPASTYKKTIFVLKFLLLNARQCMKAGIHDGRELPCLDSCKIKLQWCSTPVLPKGKKEPAVVHYLKHHDLKFKSLQLSVHRVAKSVVVSVVLSIYEDLYFLKFFFPFFFSGWWGGYKSSSCSSLIFIQMGQWIQTEHLTFGDVLNIMLGSSALLIMFPELQRNFDFPDL